MSPVPLEEKLKAFGVGEMLRSELPEGAWGGIRGREDVAEVFDGMVHSASSRDEAEAAAVLATMYRLDLFIRSLDARGADRGRDGLPMAQAG